MIDWSLYPSFTAHELRCRGNHCCGGRADMDPEFLEALQRLRAEYGLPMVPTSGFRCEAHNRVIGGSPRHLTGRAADIRIDARGMRKLLRCHALDAFSSIGIRCHGAHAGRFVHLDMCRPEDGVETEILWTYDRDR